MTYDVKTREKCFRSILVDMKARLDSENDFGLVVGFEKNIYWKGQEFQYMFYIDKPYDKLTSGQYDKLIELKSFAIEMFNYLVNPNSFDIEVSENAFGIEFTFTSDIDKELENNYV